MPSTRPIVNGKYAGKVVDLPKIGYSVLVYMEEVFTILELTVHTKRTNQSNAEWAQVPHIPAVYQTFSGIDDLKRDMNTDDIEAISEEELLAFLNSRKDAIENMFNKAISWLRQTTGTSDVGPVVSNTDLTLVERLNVALLNMRLETELDEQGKVKAVDLL